MSTQTSTSTKLGLWSIVLLGVNSIVGSGIFLLPNEVYKLVGNMSLVIVFSSALLITGLALCFAEAASWFYEENGGAYLYAKKAFGKFISFEVGILTYFVNLIVWAVVASSFIAALGRIFPIFYENRTISLLGNATIIVIMTLINLLGIKATKKTNNIITIAKIIPLVFIIIIGMFFIKIDNISAQPLLENNSNSWIVASITIIYAYLGFNSLATGAKDMESPQTNIPKAIVLVIGISTIIYLFIFTVCMGILGSELMYSKAPIADTAQKILGKFGEIIVMIGTLISIGGINFAFSYYAPRSGEAMAQDNLLPAIMTKTNKNGTPVFAILISTLIALLISLTGTFSELVKILVIANLIQILPTCIAILIFRKKYSHTPSFKIPGGFVVPALSILTCIWLISKSSTTELIWGFGSLIIGIPLYFLFTLNHKKPLS